MNTRQLPNSQQPSEIGSEGRPISVVDVAASSTSHLASLSRVVFLDEGLHALIIGPSAPTAPPVGGIALPATVVAAGPSEDYAPVEIALSSGEVPGWLGTDGGTVVARVAHGGGVVVVTSYGVGDEAELSQLQIVNLEGPGVAPEEAPRPEPARLAPAPNPAPVKRNVDIEMTLHIERQGDRQMMAQEGWVGNPGQHRRIEGFGVRPLGELRPGDIEYMAYGPSGQQTPWMSDAKLCGTRGRGLPLTGFAIRLAPALRERYDVVYEGSFFASGAIGPSRNGEPCVGQFLDDPLEAIRLRVTKRDD